MENIIVLENITKTYISFNSTFDKFKFLLKLNKTNYKEKFILRNISFNIRKGDSVGIIGLNGAGKSTLLKLIYGVTKPTSGNVSIFGSISAILELGMGFDPSLTGRQNAMFALQMQGTSEMLSKSLILNIAEFAEIGEYFDMPLNVYSTGMLVRLAFGVSTAVRPDILIVDEALSVGDFYFQQKSFNKIKEFKKLGTTLLIVSHDKNAILSICDNVILLKDAEIIKTGNPEYVFDYYNIMLNEESHKSIILENIIHKFNKVQLISGSGEAIVTSIELLNNKGFSVSNLYVSEAFSIKVKISIVNDIDKLIFGFSIKDNLGRIIFGTNTSFVDKELYNLKKGCSAFITISLVNNLGAGIYSISTALVDSDNHLNENYEWKDNSLIFEVFNEKYKFIGTTWVDPFFHIKVLD